MHRKLIWILLASDLVLVALHYLWGGKLGFFNLDREQNLASVYSGFKLIIVGALAFLISWLAALQKTKTRAIAWALAGAGFIFIGLDDMMAIHERIGFVLNNWTGIGGYYGESFNWLIYFTPLVAAAVLIYLYLIRSIWKDHRAAAYWMLAGTVLFSLSLVSEVVGAKLLLAPKINIPWYYTEIVIEEFFEMIGATCFFVGLYKLCGALFHRTFTRRDT